MKIRQAGFFADNDSKDKNHFEIEISNENVTRLTRYDYDKEKLNSYKEIKDTDTTFFKTEITYDDSSKTDPRTEFSVINSIEESRQQRINESNEKEFSELGISLIPNNTDLAKEEDQEAAKEKSLSRFDMITSNIEGDGFIASNQDQNTDKQTFGEAASSIGSSALNSLGGLVGVNGNTVKDLKNGFDGIKAGLGALADTDISGAGGVIKGLTKDLSELNAWKEEKYKQIHVNDWRDSWNLNRTANAANSAASDLRGELGKTTGGAAGKASADSGGNSWARMGGQLMDTLLGGAGTANSIMNMAGDISGEDLGDSAWNTEADELAALNTVTKDTMYTGKPGTRFKAKPGMIQNITNDEESTAIFGTSRYVKYGDDVYRSTYGDTLDKLRGGQISSTRLSEIRRIIVNSDNVFRKKTNNYSIIKDKSANFSVSLEGDNKVVWELSDDAFTGFNLSDEEMQLITLLKNKNTFNKSLGYIYIRPYYSYKNNDNDTGDNKGFRLFDIPFEFTPKISEGAMQANYQTETLLGRLGQFQIYTGTNLSTLSIELEYLALAPDGIDTDNNINKQYGTDAWQYYWTNSRIEAIELKLRSLVLADYVNADYLIKPPLVEIHLENNLGDKADSVGDLYKYPNGVTEKGDEKTINNLVGTEYLRYSTSLHGNDSNRYKKYIVNSVQIDKLTDADVIYPSLYGRKFDDTYSDRSNTMWHLTTNGDKGYAGYSRQKGFKAILQLTEVTENFLDLVPDFKAYYDAWTFKEIAANITDDYVSAKTGTGKDSIKMSVEETLKTAVNTFKQTAMSEEAKLESFYKEAEMLAKLYACTNSTKKDKKGKDDGNLYLIGDYNSFTNSFAFLKSTNAVDEKNENKLINSFLTNKKRNIYNSSGLSISNYNKDPKDKELTILTEIRTLKNRGEEINIERGIYRNLKNDEKSLLEEDNLFKNNDFLKLFDNNKFAEKIYLSSKRAAIKINPNAAAGIIYNLTNIVIDYTDDVKKEAIGNLENYELQTDVKIASGTTRLNINNGPSGVEEDYDYAGNVSERLEKFYKNVNTFAKNLFNIIIASDSDNNYMLEVNKIFNVDIPGITKGIKLKSIASEVVNLVSSDNSFSDNEKCYKIITKIKELNDYLLNNSNDFKGFIKEVAEKALGTNIPDNINLKRVGIYPVNNSENPDTDADKSAIVSNKLYQALQVEAGGVAGNYCVSLEVVSELIDYIIKSHTLIKDNSDLSNLHNFDLLGKIQDRLEEAAEKYDPTIVLENIKNTCLINNCLSLLGFEDSSKDFNSGKIWGIEKTDYTKPTTLVLPYWFEPEDNIDFYFHQYGKNNGALINLGIKSDNEDDWFVNIGDTNLITYIYDPSTQAYLTNGEEYKIKEFSLVNDVITIKDVLKSLCKSYDDTKNSFIKLIEENSSMVSLDYSNLKNVNFTNSLEEAYNKFTTEVAANLGNSGVVLDPISIKNSIVNFLDKVCPESIEKNRKTLNTYEILCEGTYTRDAIEKQFTKLAETNNNSDKLNSGKLPTLEENLKNFKDYVKGVNKTDNKELYCYKINNDYALKELNFKNANSEIKAGSDASGHGEIYKTYIAKKDSAELVSKMEKATTTVAIENYNKLV